MKLNNVVAFMEYDKVPYTLSNIIAEGVKVKHSSITRTIRKHEKDFEEFGKLGFKIRPSDSGQGEKIYKLNEDQAILLITYLKNTQFQIQRAIEKPLRKSLTDAISTWEHGNKWSYKAITDLLYKCVTGMCASKLKASRGNKNGIGLDLLETREIEYYKELESIVIALISLNWTYENIKNELYSKELKRCI